ncbi:hypothetical protein MGYG_08873 [Nannizzia gypsea CBS 118893]|uniref:Uncharacterized protein n=1 Tax=Arthroderma gypseum (strain ATCC MYA-4604 / CBS 118893) TaxID=535722 RepID=E4V783_ARTGP|nr:hypothetical protein MGYG_08873 [Nannizzia gypsea CBS 118893]EFQ96949.1 hypothetical protein MGYG_08873 [Nannizzia gypsea CBS 118893]
MDAIRRVQDRLGAEMPQNPTQQKERLQPNLSERSHDPDARKSTQQPVPESTASLTSISSETKPPMIHGESQLASKQASQDWPRKLHSPRFAISVDVYHHLFDQVHPTNEPRMDIYVWTFVTRDLKAAAAGELIMSILQRPDESPESFPMDFLHICDTVYERAKEEGLLLRRWRLLTLHKPLFGRSTWNTIVLAFRNTPISGLQSLRLDEGVVPHFHCQVFSEAEAAAARQHGITRLSLRLGISFWFPFPLFVDRDRGEIKTLKHMDTSILASTYPQTVKMTGLNVFRREVNGSVVLHVPPDQVDWFIQEISEKQKSFNASLLILAEMHDACQGVLVWLPGQPAQIWNIDAHGMKDVAVNFLLLSFNQPTEDVRTTEDGLLILLNPKSTASFFQAACNGQRLVLKPGSQTFELSWPPSWPAPTFSSASSTPSLCAVPQGGEALSPGHVKVDILLPNLSPPSTVNSEALGEFTNKFVEAIEAVIPPEQPPIAPGGCGILARFQLPKETKKSFGIEVISARLDMETQMRLGYWDPLAGNEIQDLTNRVHEIMDGLQAPDGIVYGDSFEWTVRFACWGFSWKNVPQAGRSLR